MLEIIQKFGQWWNTKPSDSAQAPKDCFNGDEEQAIAIWISAWLAFTEET